MELHLVMASNDGYAPYMGVSLFSMLENNAKEFDRIHIYIIDNGISEENREKLQAQTEVYPHVTTTFHDLRDRLSEFHPKIDNGWDNAVYGRIFIDEVVEEGVEKALYVDGDTIVKGSLRELMCTDLGENCLAGVTDFSEPKRIRYLNMAETDHYINSGVLLVDLKNYREFEARNKIIQFVNTFDKRLDYPDQDAINAACGNKIHILSPKYNFGWYLTERGLRWDYRKVDFRYSYEDLYETVKNNFANVTIFHFFGSEKPWVRGRCSALYENIWQSYNEKSGWNIKRKFSSSGAMLKFYFITVPKRWLLTGVTALLGSERYDKICGFYQEHWGIRKVQRAMEKRKDLDTF